MKKLMIAFAAVAMAAAANAGAYTWGLQSGEDYASDGSTYLTETPFTVMLFTGTIGQTDNGDGTYSLDFSKATYITQTSDFDGDAYTIGEPTYDAARTHAGVSGADKQAFAMLVLDTGAGISDYANYEGTYAVVAGEGSLLQDKDSGDYYSSFITLAAVEGGDYRTASAVPEPTSGLLLLLGVAGLALRRRRA